MTTYNLDIFCISKDIPGIFWAVDYHLLLWVIILRKMSRLDFDILTKVDQVSYTWSRIICFQTT